MSKQISIVIPNYNCSSTIGKCLEAAFSSDYDNYEVVVVDDRSTDNSLEIIKKFPCKLIRLDKHSGASKARNTGAQNSSGEILFFIDADCILQKDTLALVNKACNEYSPPHPPFSKGGQRGVVIGGTYTRIPYDDNFFSTFQSIFINYFETKKQEPDYIAAHAMVIDSKVFKENGGFPENFLPIIEDVEFSHRLRRSGVRLVMNPEILVQHIFNFTFTKSLKNAFRKSMYWTVYSMKNRNLLTDSGTASLELKADVISCFSILLLMLIPLALKNYFFITAIPFIAGLNIFLNRRLFFIFYEAKGMGFAFPAILHYMLLYPIAVGAGALTGMIKYYFQKPDNK